MSIEKFNPFPIDVYKISCSGHEKIKEYLMKHVYDDFEKNGPNGGLQQIYTDYLPGTGKMVHWPFMYNLYAEDIKNVLTEIGFDVSQFDIRLKGWYNFTTGNSEEWVHDHVGGASTINYSFVHYITIDDSANGTVFLNPNYKMIRSVSPTKNVNYLPKCFFDERMQIPVQEGDILFFPSWLDHTAPQHTSGNLRITNAVNVMMRLKNHDEDGF